MQLSQLQKFKRRLLQIAGKHGVKKIYVFGSVARGEAAASSDVDFLIEMDKDASALGVGGFQFEAQALLGAALDVVPTFALHQNTDREFVEAIQAQAIPL